jgi:cytochrome c oxidase cbb3-type subunit 3
MLGITAVAALLLVLLLSWSTAIADDKDKANKAGQAAFKGNCVVCHGGDGSGTPLGKSMQAVDLHSPEVQKKSDAQLAQTITEGKGNMPSFKRVLDPGQIEALVGYVRELGKNQK